jgi:hypothetical protein
VSAAPAAGAVVLDHVGLFVPDMARAAAAFERLGHRPAPGGPLVPAGTANRLAMLAEGYVEILTPVAETPVAGQLPRPRPASPRRSTRSLRPADRRRPGSDPPPPRLAPARPHAAGSAVLRCAA